ncbi:MAG: GNAT family N-acetyltransferase [Treponema sp.]
MNFILSSEIIKEIIFAMENQAQISLFDTECCTCVPVPEDFEYPADFSAVHRFYPIPEWNPAQGFRLMELFTAKVHNPLVREALQGALMERRGVFRRFKELLKTRPEIEVYWFQFKEAYMQGVVYDWYNELRQCWGLERISFDEEEMIPIVRQDFSFEVILGYENMLQMLKQFEERSRNGLSVSAVQKTDSFIETLSTQLQNCFLSHCQLDEAVCIIASADSTADEKNNACGLCILLLNGGDAAVIPALKVMPEYRGMGIGKELLHQALRYARKARNTAIIFAELSIPDYFHAFLERTGFIRTGLLYRVSLKNSGMDF